MHLSGELVLFLIWLYPEIEDGMKGRAVAKLDKYDRFYK